MSEETLAVMSNSDREASLNPAESSDAASIKTEKRSRASKPKTKTGCFTCRTRRVKCDEQKPFCNRCIKFGVACDGYGVKERKKPTTKKQRVEQAAALTPPILLPKANDVQALISRFGSGVRFESELEARYFRVFCDQVAGQITGFFKTSLWERLIPQASEITPFIRHAIVAIGALSSLSKDTNFPLSPIGKHGLAEEHLYALTQYDKALQETKQLIATGGGSVRNALLGCLLFFCFETLQGRQGPACALARSGLTLFYRWAEEQKMTSQQILEDEIIQAFESLNLQVLFFIDERPLDLHQRLMKEATNGLEHMPSMFVDLDEARSYWQLIMRRNFHFKIEAQIKGNAADLVGEQRDMNWSDSANFCGGDIPFSKLKNPTPEIQWACQKYIEDIIRWSSAATTLFESIPPNDMSSVIVANLLKIHALMNILILAGMTFSAETRFDAYLSEFREIVDLCTFCHPHLMASSEQSTLYRFDLGIIPALSLVASRCRDREIRARSIDLLESCHYREGFWDSYLMGAIGRWLRDLEEEAAGPNTYIPEDCRHFPTSADVDLYNRRVKVYATQRRGPRDEDMVFKEAILRW